MAVGFLGDGQVAQHPQAFLPGARGQQAAGALHEIPGPDQVVAAQVPVALGEAPGDGEAGDDPAGNVRGLVGAQDGGGGAVQVARRGQRAPQGQQAGLPGFPAAAVGRGRLVEVPEAHGGAMGRFAEGSPEPQGQDEAPARGHQIDFPGEGDVAVLRPVVLPRQPLVQVQVGPAVGDAHEAGGAPGPGRGAGQRQGHAVPFGEQHGPALHLAHPAGIAGPGIAQVRRQQREQGIVAQPAPQRGEPDPLQDHLPDRIGQDLLLDAVAALHAGVHQAEGGHAVGDGCDPGAGMALLLRQESPGAGHDQAQIADAGLVIAGIVDFVEDAVAEGEPDPAAREQGGAHPALGAGGPARLDAGPARSGGGVRLVGHRGLRVGGAAAAGVMAIPPARGLPVRRGWWRDPCGGCCGCPGPSRPP